MPTPLQTRFRLCLTLAVTLFEVLHLGWEHVNGGVVSHHLLNRSDLPAISNAWGLLLLPLLAWFTIGRVQARSVSGHPWGIDPPARWAFTGALLYGATLSVGFTLGAEAVISPLFLALFAVAVALPLYRLEYPLGFVLGMMVTFGAVLPMLVSTVFILVSLIAHPLLRRGVRALRRPARAA